MPKTLLAALAVLAAVSTALGACGIPTDGQPVAVEAPANFGAAPAARPTAQASEATRFQIWLVGTDGYLTSTRRELGTRTVDGALELLLAGATADERANEQLSSNLPAGTQVLSTSVEGSVATINLAPGSIDQLAGAEQLTAIAQIVFTATFTGIQAVLFEIGDEPVQVPTDAGQSEPGQPVGRDNYQSFNREFADAEPTAETTPVGVQVPEPPEDPTPTPTPRFGFGSTDIEPAQPTPGEP